MCCLWQELLPALYRGHDALLFTSRSEAWGMPVLEGMASGLACVATNCLGVQTFAQHGVNALLAKPQVGPLNLYARLRQGMMPLRSWLTVPSYLRCLGVAAGSSRRLIIFKRLSTGWACWFEKCCAHAAGCGVPGQAAADSPRGRSAAPETRHRCARHRAPIRALHHRRQVRGFIIVGDNTAAIACHAMQGNAPLQLLHVTRMFLFGSSCWICVRWKTPHLSEEGRQEIL